MDFSFGAQLISAVILATASARGGAFCFQIANILISKEKFLGSGKF
jgi:hypothetical protein